ncbi:MAG TPA: hypothetical protein VK162_24695 [Streptosporangiaceae bacterium]|nr:hypothetical protein [Streptosporangiaceae bacterium]
MVGPCRKSSSGLPPAAANRPAERGPGDVPGLVVSGLVVSGLVVSGPWWCPAW